MTDPSPSAPRSDTPESAGSEGRPAPTHGLLAAALTPGRSYHERQRDLVHASLIAPWGPKQARTLPRA